MKLVANRQLNPIFSVFLFLIGGSQQSSIIPNKSCNSSKLNFAWQISSLYYQNRGPSFFHLTNFEPPKKLKLLFFLAKSCLWKLTHSLCVYRQSKFMSFNKRLDNEYQDQALILEMCTQRLEDYKSFPESLRSLQVEWRGGSDQTLNEKDVTKFCMV